MAEDEAEALVTVGDDDQDDHDRATPITCHQTETLLIRASRCVLRTFIVDVDQQDDHEEAERSRSRTWASSAKLTPSRFTS